jgi:hypothetical protein
MKKKKNPVQHLSLSRRMTLNRRYKERGKQTVFNKEKMNFLALQVPRHCTLALLVKEV